MSDSTRGLYCKYDVQRIDNQDRPGRKHHGCDYFVLDLTHDPHAYPALKAYAHSCRDTHPGLAADLERKADEMIGNGVAN
jgi:hypothetical protein